MDGSTTRNLSSSIRGYTHSKHDDHVLHFNKEPVGVNYSLSQQSKKNEFVT